MNPSFEERVKGIARMLGERKLRPPFNVAVPTKTTEKVLKDTDVGRNLVRCDDAEDMFSRLGI